MPTGDTLTVALACLAALLAIWVGYPLVVFALAALKPRRETEAVGELPNVTIVVATLEGPTAYNARIRNAFDSEYPAAKLSAVVSLDVASDHALDALPAPGMDPRLQVVRGDEPAGKATALNAGVRASTGEILVFSDVAQRFDRTTIPGLVEALRRDERLGAVSGMLALGTGGREGAQNGLMARYWNLERRLREREAKLHSAVGVTGAVYAMRRSCWKDLPARLILDDLYGPMRLALDGWRIGFRSDALAHDDRTFEVQQELRRKVRTLTGVLQLCAWLPSVLNPMRNPIWLQFVWHKLFRLVTPYLVGVMALALAIEGALAFARATLTQAVVAILAVLAGFLAVAASRRLLRALRMGLAMQVAVVRATVNGLRGNWDVWSR